jgi:hypothetical protein
MATGRDLLTSTLTDIARAYHEHFSQRCSDCTLSECMDVLNLPLPVSGMTTSQVTKSTIAGLPGFGGSEGATPPKRIARKKNDGNNPHEERGPAYDETGHVKTVGPPVQGYCSYKVTKGKRSGCYCKSVANIDPGKGNGLHCGQCYSKGKNKLGPNEPVGGVAPGIIKNTAGFRSSIPDARKETMTFTRYGKPDSPFYSLPGTDLIFMQSEESPGMYLAVGKEVDGPNGKFVEYKFANSDHGLLRSLNLNIMKENGDVVEPDHVTTTSQIPALPPSLPTFGISTSPSLPPSGGFAPPSLPPSGGFAPPSLPPSGGFAPPSGRLTPPSLPPFALSGGLTPPSLPAFNFSSSLPLPGPPKLPQSELSSFSLPDQSAPRLPGQLGHQLLPSNLPPSNYTSMHPTVLSSVPSLVMGGSPNLSSTGSSPMQGYPPFTPAGSSPTQGYNTSSGTLHTLEASREY